MKSDLDLEHSQPGGSTSASSSATESDSRVQDRRKFLFKLSIAINAAIGLLIATPVVRFLLGPLRAKGGYDAWIPLGKVADYQPGTTILATYRNPFTTPWDGDTANVACYVRCQPDGGFTVFAVNCAHLGCPVRWFPQSQLFLCPCHGGAYYADGSRAAGPPERGLFTYASRIDGDTLMIQAGQLPTLANQARFESPNDFPGSRAAIESAQRTRSDSHSASHSGSRTQFQVKEITPCTNPPNAGTNEPTIG
jgi:menaquinol-cytochrome c reductase iron-sulfur subunit